MHSKQQIDFLKEALDKSSSHNSRLLLLLLLFLVYALVTVATTTDLQLLIPDSKVRLPIVDVELPLFEFYIVSPILIVIFHFNMLFNLLQHSKKLYEWDKNSEDGDRLLIYPFIFNFLVSFKKKDDENDDPLKRIMQMVIYVFPPSILLYIQVTFSAYHSLGMTFFHFFLIVADCFLVFMYWTMIKWPAELIPRWYNSFKNIWVIIRRNLPFWVPIFFLIFISLGNLIILLLVKQVDIKYLTYIKPVIPQLVLIDQTLVASPPSDEIIQRYLAMGKSEGDALADFAKGLNLRGRDLKFAVFYNSNLQKADLIEAKLQGAHLSGARLQGANLYKAKLQGAHLSGARLQGANLDGAELQSAKLDGTHLQGVDLSKAQLQGVNLRGAQLQGANLLSVRLQGANLYGVQLQGANLNSAELQGANLYETDLRGTSLREAQLQGVNLSNAHLQGVDLSKAQLQGANLSGAYLYCVDFNGANLEGLLFENIDTKTEVNWDELFKKISPLIPKPKAAYETDAPVSFSLAYEYRLKDIFSNQAINNVKQRCKNLKKETFPALHSDFNKFIKVRSNLACKDIIIAKGMLKQYGLDPFGFIGLMELLGAEIYTESNSDKKIKKEIIKHMQSQCPENLKRLNLIDNIKEK